MQDNVWAGLRPGRSPLRVDMEMYMFNTKNRDDTCDPNNSIPTSQLSSSSATLSAAGAKTAAEADAEAAEAEIQPSALSALSLFKAK